MRVAVLGLGKMGSAIAGRLLAGGHDVVVWNRTAPRTASLVSRGARAAADVAAAADGAHAVLVSVRDDEAARAVLGELVAAGVSVPVVNCSTSGPGRTTELAGMYGAFVAAPILGAPRAVADGSAAYLVAGPAAALGALEPMWPALTGKVVHCGSDPTRAGVAKLVSNNLLLTGLVALSEGVAVGQAAGLDDALLRDLLTTSPLVAPGLRNRLDDVVDGDHTAGWFDTPLGAKDLGLFVDLGAAHGVTPPLAALARDRYAQAAARGLADVDVAAVVELLRPTAGGEQR